MPSARLVFNDDASVLGPVLDRTSEMIKASMSDIPRIRMQQEQQAREQDYRQHSMANQDAELALRKQGQAADLELRKNAAANAQDQQLLGLLTMGGGPTRKGRSTGAASGVPSVGQQLALQKYADKGAADRKKEAFAPHVEWQKQWDAKFKAENGKVIKDPETFQERRQTDKEARALADEAYPVVPDPSIDTSGELFGQPATYSAEGSAADVPAGMLQFPVDPAVEADNERARALQQQDARRAFVAVKAKAAQNPAWAAANGIDENRLAELYRIHWPEAPENIQETVGPIDFSPDAPAEAPPVAAPDEAQVEAPAEAPSAAPQAGFRTPDNVRVGEHQRSSEVDAAIKALLTRAAADPQRDVTNQGASFSINGAQESFPSTGRPQPRLTMQEEGDLLRSGNPAGDVLPEWLGGTRRADANQQPGLSAQDLFLRPRTEVAVRPKPVEKPWVFDPEMGRRLERAANASDPFLWNR